MSIHDTEDQLFLTWQERYNHFVKDGAVDERAYLSSSLKILFLLKEVSDPEGGWDLRELLRSNIPSQTWNNIARWTYGILNVPQFQPWAKIPSSSPSFRQEWLKNIVAVNIKKTGGRSVADPAGILEFVSGSKDDLRRQLNLYAPSVTICCGTAEYLPHLFDQQEIGEWSTSSNGTRYARSPVLGSIIHYFHPQVHYPANFLYTMLMGAVQEVLSSSKR